MAHLVSGHVDHLPGAKIHDKQQKRKKLECSDDDVPVAGEHVSSTRLYSPVKKQRTPVVNTHTMSDSDSDTELPVPLFERIQQQKNILIGHRPALDDHNLSAQPSFATSNTFLHSSAGSKPRDFSRACSNTHKFPFLQSDHHFNNLEKEIPCTIKIGQQMTAKNIGIENRLEKRKKKEEQEQRKSQKEEERKRRKQELEEKRKKKEYEKTKKRTVRETERSSRPGEAIKHMTVMLDAAILKTSAGAVILDTLQKQDVTYEIQSQPLPGIITFWREVAHVIEKQPLQLETEKKEVVQDEILLVLPVDKFVSLVHNFKQKQIGQYMGAEQLTLREHIIEVRKVLENRKVTLIVQEIEKYFREQQTLGKKNYRSKVTGQEMKNRKKNGALSDVDVHRLDVEEAMIDVQLHTGCCVRFVASDIEMGKTVLQYTKAIAEAPFKRDHLNNGLSLYIENRGAVKISKEGLGVQQAWRQQLQQFRNVKAEVANAIMSQYMSPIELWKAYQSCETDKEAELLLQDILIRRGVGVMATSRRVGKELSHRLYQLFTSDDPTLLLK